MYRTILCIFFFVTVFTFLIFGCKNAGTSEDSKGLIPILISEQTDVDVPQNYVANIQAVRFVEIKPKIEGFIDAIYVDEGKRVKSSFV